MIRIAEQELHPGKKHDFEEGDFLNCSWGYNQTNVNFAKIVEVSETRKTVVCRLVKARKLEGGDRTSKKIMPKDEEYGDEFRLHVRDGYKDEPSFVGSYPHCTGDKEDGTRKGYFRKWDKTSTRETRSGMGH